MGTANVDIVVRLLQKGPTRLKGLLNLREDLLKIRKGGTNVGTALNTVDKRINSLTGGAKGVALQFRRFKFEMLGVLFFGMAITRFFKGLIKPSFDLIGIFEDLNLIIGVAFLPTSIKVSKKLRELALDFANLPEPIRELTGDFILAAAGVGVLATFIGILALGLPSIATALGTTTGAILLLGGELIIVIAAVLFFIQVMKDWDEKSDTTKLSLAGITGGIGLLAIALGKGSPWFIAVILAIAAITLLRLNFDKLNEIADKDEFTGSKLGIGIQKFIKQTIELIRNLREIQTLLAVPSGFGGFGGGRASGNVGFTGSFGEPAVANATTTNTNTFNIDINVSGIGAEIGGIAEQIRRELDESISTQLESINRTG